MHIGTQKTGTSALQAAFAAGDSWLERSGLYYPVASRLYAGHHNAALGLLDSPRYDPSRGDVEALLDDVAAHADRVGIVSSEAFHMLAGRPDALAELRSALARRGLEARFVLYVRDRASYAESLYTQLLKLGLTLDFPAFAASIEANGRFDFARDRWYAFNYATIARAFGADCTIVRPYVRSVEPDWITRDFLQAIGIDAPVGLQMATPIANRGASFRSAIERWLANRSVRPEDARIDDAARAVFGNDAEAVLGGPFWAFDVEQAQRFSDSFADDDALLLAEFGTRPIRAPRLDHPSGMRMFDLLADATSPRPSGS